MSGQNQIDYNALAQQAGAVASQPATPDYAALAKQAGAVSSVPAAPTSEADAVAQAPNAAQQAHQQILNTPMATSTVGNIHSAVGGDNTALGQGATPNLQTEGAGVSDIFHGNIRKGLGEVVEANTPHIIAGSPVERIIQKVNPNFRGTATPEYQAAHPTVSSLGDHPVVDAAQFIDKNKHPVLKAVTEAGQSLTNPNNVAVMVSTGGLGMVDSPTNLAVANKLLSAGFSASAIGNAYAHLSDFKTAYDSGNTAEALYQLTHGVLSGAVAIAAGTHTATGDSPITTAGKVAGKVGDVATSAGDLVNRGRDYLADKAVGPLVKKTASETVKDEKFNREPTKAILDEGLTGTRKQLVAKSEQRISELGDGVDHVLQNHPNSNNIIDVEPVIDSAIKDAQSSAEKIGDANKVQVLENLKTALKTKFGAIKGTPFEMNNLKRDIGDVGSEIGAFKSTDPIEASRAAVMGDVYRGIKELVNKEVPEVKDLNDRISNLISAKTGLQRNISLHTNKPFIDSHMTVLGTAAKIFENTVTSAPMRTWAAKAIKSGKTLAPPKTVGDLGIEPTHRLDENGKIVPLNQ